MKTNYQDPQTSEIRSTQISGMQESLGKIEDILDMQLQAETGIALTEVFVSAEDRYRIYQAPAGKRNWAASPAPVIKKNDIVVTEGFTIDYAGGSIIVSPSAILNDVFTADASYTKTAGNKLETHLADLEYDIKNPPIPMIAAKGNANYYNSADSKWYEDAGFTVLAINDGPAINAIIAAAMLNGRNVKIPHGSYWCDNTTITIDNSASTHFIDKKKINLIGEGIQQSRINYTGASRALSIIGGKTGEYNAMQSHQKIEGFTLWGNLTDNSTGLHIDTCQGLHISGVRIANFYFGVYGEDVDNATFTKTIIHWNKRGIYMLERNPRNPLSSTRPNEISFYDCHIGGNHEYGGYFAGGSCINFFGGHIEGNGVASELGTSSKWGILLLDPCVQGGVGCNFEGVFIESNKGIADVRIWTQTPSPLGPTPAVYNFKGCTFNRTQDVNICTYNILAAFTAATFGQQKLVVEGCGFKNFNGAYTPSSARPHIGFVLDVRSTSNCYFANNVQSDDVEKITEDTQMPISTATAGAIGEYKQILGTVGAALSLPAGGVWEWHGFWVNNSTGVMTFISGTNAGIANGGTTILAAQTGLFAVANIRRIS